MAALTRETITRSGIDPTFVSAAGGGDTFANDGLVFFVVKNGSGGEITITFVTTSTVLGFSVTDMAVAVANGAEGWIGPFPQTNFNDSDGLVSVTYSGVGSVTVSAVRIVPEG